MTEAKENTLAQGIAHPGEEWASAICRARRLLGAVCTCEPCRICGDFWLDDGREECAACGCDHYGDWIDEGEAQPGDDTVRCAPGEYQCLACPAAAVPFGSFCAACYGEWLHPEGLPLEPGDPLDPWREFNAEANALILDRRMPLFLYRRMGPHMPPAPPPPDPFDDNY